MLLPHFCQLYSSKYQMPHRYLVWLCLEANPAIVDWEDEVAAGEVNADLTPAEQQERVHRHHRAVTNIDLEDTKMGECQTRNAS